MRRYPRPGWRGLVLCLAVAWPGGGFVRAADIALPNPRFTGSPFMQVWMTDELGGAPVNHGVVQHPPTGFIYVANNAGLLEFDGVRWRLIPLPDGGRRAHAVTVDARDRLWFLGAGSIGRMEPDANGDLQPVSAMARLPAGERGLAQPIGALAAPEGVYFTGRRRLIFFPLDDAQPARVWPLAANLAGIWRMDGVVHVALEDETWWQIRDGELVRCAVRRPAVFAAVRRDGETVVLTQRGPRRADAVDTPMGDPWGAEPARAAWVLADGRLAFGTEREGLLLLDANGRFLQRLDRDLGLPANRVEALYEDREGGLWIALHRGLARVQLDSPFASHGVPQRLHGSPQAVTRIDGRLYVAHSEGVVVADPRGGFQSVTSIPGGLARALGPANDFFLSAALHQLAGPEQRGRVPERTAFGGFVSLSTAPGMFVLGAPTGIFLCRAEGESWKRIGQLKGAAATGTPQCEAPAGVLWVSGRGQLRRVDFRDGVKTNAPVRVYDAAEGVPPPPRRYFLRGGQLGVRTPTGVVRYDAKADRFVPDRPEDGASAGEAVALGGADDDETGRPNPAEPANLDRRRIDRLASTSLSGLRILSVYHDAATRTEWLSGQGGLISMDLDWQPAHPPGPLNAVVRRVMTPDGERVMARELDPAHRALRFEFAAATFQPDMRGNTNVMFRSRVDGLDADWTPWSREAFREIANLPFRELRLRVQARDHTGRESGEGALAFAIAPPWWRTGWALSGGWAAGALAVVGIVGLRTRTLRRRAAALEAVVVDRTAALHAQNRELSRLHRLELDENASLRLAEEKARLEVLRYQLNPHFLYNSLNSIYGLLFENARGAGEMVLRLSEFCRATLTVRDGEQPTLGSEFQVLRIYLEVEKVRWGDGLQVEFNVDPGAEALRLPPFLLLPLVENAVKYGGRTSPGALRLRLIARREADVVRIEIANTGQWLAPDATRPDSTGLGLDNLRQRLSRHFPAAHEFAIAPVDGWVVATLRIRDRVGNTSPTVVILEGASENAAHPSPAARP